jgi:formylglycine-generating enzyme required for sulfatase activity
MDQISPNTILKNRYRIIRHLGKGGMGNVYETLDESLSAIVALKQTSVVDNEEAKRAFKREADLLANLHHQALPRVMDYFIEDDGEFLVMEFIEGYDLAELLELHGSPFDVSQVVRWADEILKVLEYLHGRVPPILHRDIKPSNLKLNRQGNIFLLDFGLAKGAAGQMPTLVTSHSVRGYTPVYAPLEQILGQGTNPRSDLYSLGATLYHLLTGEPPIDAPNRDEQMEDDKQDPLLPIQQFNPLVPSSIAEVIHQAMAVKRKYRLESATEMRRALQVAEEEAKRAVEEQQRRDEEQRREEEEKLRLAEEEARRIEAERKRLEVVQAARHAEEEQRLKEEIEKWQREAARAKAEREHAEEELRLRTEEEAARRKLEEERRLEEHERLMREAEEATRRRAIEEEQDRRNESVTEIPTMPASDSVPVDALKTIPSPTQAAQGVKKPDTPPVNTIRSGSSTGVTWKDEKATQGNGVIAPKAAIKNGRFLMLIALVVVIAIALFITLMLMRQKETGGGQVVSENKVPIMQPSPTQTNQTPTPPSGMVYVPGGEFMMGRDDGDEFERPARQVTVKPFFIDIYEVTNEEYAKFVKAKSGPLPQTWINGTYPAGKARQPVVGVKWDDARAYAEWAGKRLPTEEEWEFAARGTDKFRYPWGNSWLSGLANADGASTSMADVGAYKGTSPFGTFDMVGNAWEWTSSRFEANQGRKPSPKQPPDEKPSPKQPSEDFRVIRGGSYLEDKNEATTTYRRGYPARGNYDYGNTGFRCAQDLSKAIGQN